MHAAPLQILGCANYLSLGSLVNLARMPLLPVSRLIVERATARHCSECKVSQDEQRICHRILLGVLITGYRFGFAEPVRLTAEGPAVACRQGEGTCGGSTGGLGIWRRPDDTAPAA